MEMLTRERRLAAKAITLFSFDGARFASDVKGLQEWHREQERRGLSGSWMWHYQHASEESVLRGNRQSVRSRKRRVAKKRNDASDGELPEELSLDKELEILAPF